MRFIPIHAVMPGMMVGRDIHMNRKTVAMLKKGMLLTEEHINYLTSHGYMGVYVSDLVSEDVEIEETVAEETFDAGVNAVAEENIGHMVKTSTEIVKEIMDKETVNVDLIDLRSFDDYTYHHSVNVAVYSVVVGKKLGLSEKEVLTLSQAAICHDLGKKYIPEQILNKPGRLTDEEYEIVKTHPEKSLEVLNKNGGVSSVVKQAVLFHHENENGSGYPLHKRGSELPMIVKIIHAVDVYDALTSKRPYKNPYAPVDAFEYLKGGCDILFNRQVVEAMLQSIPAYPPGIDVTLSSGQTGIVLGHTSDALRPRIKLIEDGTILNLSKPENASFQIVKSGIMPSDYSEEVELLNETRNHSPVRKKTVMIVDDMIVSMMQTKTALEQEYQVTAFRSAIEVLEVIAQKGCPDLIITEVEIPALSGFGLIQALRGMGMEVPVIFLTSRTDKDTVLKCVELGGTDYIVKPAPPVYLRERVAQIFEGVNDR